MIETYYQSIVYFRVFNLGVRRRELFNTIDLFQDFDDMYKELNRMSNMFNDISLINAPKEMIKEYETSNDSKVREACPIVYGYSMTISPDGKPHVREFENVKSLINNVATAF